MVNPFRHPTGIVAKKRKEKNYTSYTRSRSYNAVKQSKPQWVEDTVQALRPNYARVASFESLTLEPQALRLLFLSWAEVKTDMCSLPLGKLLSCRVANYNSHGCIWFCARVRGLRTRHDTRHGCKLQSDNTTYTGFLKNNRQHVVGHDRGSMRYSMIHTTQFRGHVVKYYIGLYKAWKALQVLNMT